MYLAHMGIKHQLQNNYIMFMIWMDKLAAVGKPILLYSHAGI